MKIERSDQKKSTMIAAEGEQEEIGFSVKSMAAQKP